MMALRGRGFCGDDENISGEIRTSSKALDSGRKSHGRVIIRKWLVVTFLAIRVSFHHIYIHISFTCSFFCRKNVHNHQPVIGQHLKYGDLGGSVLSWGYPQIIYHGWPWRLVLKFMVTWGSPIFRNLQLCWNNNGGSIWRLKEASGKKTPKLHEFPGKQGLTLSKFFASTVMEPKRSIEPLIILLK